MKIKASEAVPGQWYDTHTGTRCLCIELRQAYAQTLGFFVLNQNENLTHLPDCTGWDWQPPKPEKRYRAFASFEEWWPHRERWYRDIYGRITRDWFADDFNQRCFSARCRFLNDDGSDGEPFGVEMSE